MSDSPLTETYCTKCGHSPREQTPFCPHCGEEDSWDERPVYKFDVDALPYVFPYEVYDDNSALWRAFAGTYFEDSEVNPADIAGLPDEFPRLGYCVFTVYFIITESYELDGPYLDAKSARRAYQ